jgi:predicted negative regulator of RcsB-dependent stress response
MKKYLLLVFALALAGGIFAQEYSEYTIHYSGGTLGTVTVTKDSGGKIVIRTPGLTFKGGPGDGDDAGVLIGPGGHVVDSYLCPLLPSEGPSFNPTKGRVYVIEGNTMTRTDANGYWTKTVVDGNTTTQTNANGGWSKAVIDGNTTATTYSSGDTWKKVVEGNTTTETDASGKWIRKIVVEGNTTTETRSTGYWKKTVVNGNMTTETDANGATKTRTVAGNTVTMITTHKDGSSKKEVATKQGNNIYLEETAINFQTLTASGKAYYDQEDYDQAIADYTEAIRMHPGYAPAYVGRGNAYSKKGDYDRAIADYTQEIGLDPYSSLYAEYYRGYAYVSRGNAYNRKGDRVRARADWSKALELDPNSTAARNNLENFK